ncbi:hypothetical protein ACJX0J_016340, partial [Zea mays]
DGDVRGPVDIARTLGILADEEGLAQEALDEYGFIVGTEGLNNKKIFLGGQVDLFSVSGPPWWFTGVYGPQFYKMAWQIIKVDFMAAVNKLSYNILPQDLRRYLLSKRDLLPLVEKVCLPLTLGGLGVPNLEVMGWSRTFQEAINGSSWIWDLIVWRRGGSVGDPPSGNQIIQNIKDDAQRWMFILFLFLFFCFLDFFSGWYLVEISICLYNQLFQSKFGNSSNNRTRGMIASCSPSLRDI